MTRAVEHAIEQLVNQRSKLVSEIDALRARIAGLDAAITLLKQTTVELQGKPRPTYKTTDFILELLDRVGTNGLNAQIAAEMAAERGINLNRQSVSSLLSRMRRSGLVIYERHRYRLREITSIVGSIEVAEEHVEAA